MRVKYICIIIKNYTELSYFTSILPVYSDFHPVLYIFIRISHSGVKYLIVSYSGWHECETYVRDLMWSHNIRWDMMGMRYDDQLSSNHQPKASIFDYLIFVVSLAALFPFYVLGMTQDSAVFVQCDWPYL